MGEQNLQSCVVSYRTSLLGEVLVILSRHPGKCEMKKVPRVLEQIRIKCANQGMHAYSFGGDLNKAPPEHSGMC